jgi:hypothetical protein
MYMATGDGLCKTSDAGRPGRGSPPVGTGSGIWTRCSLIRPAMTLCMWRGGRSSGNMDPGHRAPRRDAQYRRGLTWQTCLHGLSDPLRGNIEAMSQVVSPDGVSFYIGVSSPRDVADRTRSWIPRRR